jgi:hypothetical protein
VSGNDKKLWMTTFLAEVQKEKLTTDQQTKLLLANSDIGPAHFYLIKTDDGKTWLKMGYALDNRDMVPRFFREELDWFCDKLTEKADLWNLG